MQLYQDKLLRASRHMQLSRIVNEKRRKMKLLLPTRKFALKFSLTASIHFEFLCKKMFVEENNF